MKMTQTQISVLQGITSNHSKFMPGATFSIEMRPKGRVLLRMFGHRRLVGDTYLVDHYVESTLEQVWVIDPHGTVYRM